MIELNKIYQEPCLETLKRMPNDFLDCVITSPPYWQLRDYGYEGQWGLEPTFQEYLEHLWEMMDEIYRVLKPMGTVWVNLGDSYNGTGGGHKIEQERETYKKYSKDLRPAPNGKNDTKIPNKCLLLIPHRFAIGCIERGWIMRNDIIWAKRNGMPESVTDRFSKKHEYFFFMTKSTDYYFDLDSIRDKVKPESIIRDMYDRKGNKGGISRELVGYRQSKGVKPQSQYGILDKEFRSMVVEVRDLPPHEDLRKYLSEAKKRVGLTIQQIEDKFGTQAPHHWFEKNGSYPSVEDWTLLKEMLQLDNTYDIQMTEIELKSGLKEDNPKGKNSGDVADFWDIPTKPNSDKHYASYNQDLIHKPIIAGCPENGIIYDPFMGTGSTAVAALRRNRKYIGSEMSSDYCKIADKRILPLKTQITLF